MRKELGYILIAIFFVVLLPLRADAFKRLDPKKTLYFSVVFEEVLVENNPEDKNSYDLTLIKPTVRYIFSRPYSHDHQFLTTVEAVIQKWKDSRDVFTEGLWITDKKSQKQKPILISHMYGTSQQLHFTAKVDTSHLELNKRIKAQGNVLIFSLP